MHSPPLGGYIKRKSVKSYDSTLFFGALAGTRIPGPLIKSQMLYRLSYERITIFVFGAAGYRPIILPHPGAKCKCRRKKVLFCAGRNFLFTKCYKIVTMKGTECAGDVPARTDCFFVKHRGFGPVPSHRKGEMYL